MSRITITRSLFMEFCMIKITCLLFAASFAQAASFDITQYGAVGNGTTLASAAINKAIDAASAAGGGTVHFPAGTWLSGSIHLKSNVALYLDQGATLLATALGPLGGSSSARNPMADSRTSLFRIASSITAGA